jgi:hypothetical protein
LELCNGLEAVDWTSRPIQVEVCEACGTVGCDDAGYVQISRAGEDLLWTPPQRRETSSAIRRHGAVLIRNAAWERCRMAVARVPAARDFATLRRLDLVHAWISGTHGIGRVESIDALEPMLASNLLACDSMDAAEGRRLVSELLAWVRRAPDATLDGAFVRAAQVGARVETFYYEGSPDDDWPAVSVVPSVMFAFGHDLLFASTEPLLV